MFTQRLFNNTRAQEKKEYLAFYQTKKIHNKTLDYSSNGTFRTANISMRPDAPFNNSVPVAWQGEEFSCNSAARPGSHESGLRLVPRGSGRRRKQFADHQNVQVHNYSDNAALFFLCSTIKLAIGLISLLCIGGEVAMQLLLWNPATGNTVPLGERRAD